MCKFSSYVDFNKGTDGLPGIKHDKAEMLRTMSLSMDRVEMLPPLQRSSVENQRLKDFPNSIFMREEASQLNPLTVIVTLNSVFQLYCVLYYVWGRGGSIGRASVSRSNGFHDQRFESRLGHKKNL